MISVYNSGLNLALPLLLKQKDNFSLLHAVSYVNLPGLNVTPERM